MMINKNKVEVWLSKMCDCCPYAHKDIDDFHLIYFWFFGLIMGRVLASV